MKRPDIGSLTNRHYKNCKATRKRQLHRVGLFDASQPIRILARSVKRGGAFEDHLRCRFAHVDLRGQLWRCASCCEKQSDQLH
jgi:hypothetical protein